MEFEDLHIAWTPKEVVKGVKEVKGVIADTPHLALTSNEAKRSDNFFNYSNYQNKPYKIKKNNERI